MASLRKLRKGLQNLFRSRAHFNYYRAERNSTALETFLMYFRISLVTLVPLAVTGLVIYVTVFSSVEDFRYRIGLGRAALISISILDSHQDINFPLSETVPPVEYSIGGEEEAANKFAKIMGDETPGVVWRVEGFSKYWEHFGDTSVLGRFEKFPSGRDLDTNGTGFWMFYHNPGDAEEEQGDEGVYSNDIASSIRAFNIMGHVATTNGIPLDDLEVAVAVRVYVEGEATLMIRYLDAISRHVEIEQYPSKDFKGKGFCYKILDVPFEKRIDLIHITPMSTHLRRHGIVIVDQVVIVVGRRDVTQSVMHTLVPRYWC